MKIPKEFACKPLSRDIMETHWKKLYKIDAQHVTTMELEEWNKNEYLFEIENKWQLSFYMCKGAQIIGYRIVSGRGKLHGYAHSHRTSIVTNYLRKGVGTQLLKKSVSAAKAFGYIGLTGLVHKNNIRSKKFLENTGWKNSGDILNENELWSLTFDL